MNARIKALRQDVRDAWLGGFTINEILQTNHRLLNQQEYMVVCAQWHECEQQFRKVLAK